VLSTGGSGEEGVLDMADTSTPVTDQDTDHVEAKHPFPAPIPSDPDRGRAGELALLAPVDGLYGVPKVIAATSLDLHEGHNATPLRDEIEIPMPVAEAAVQYSPSPLSQPRRRDSLALLPKHLRRRRHDAKMRAPAWTPASNELIPKPSRAHAAGSKSAHHDFGDCPCASSNSTFAAAIPATGVSILRSTLSLLRIHKCSCDSPTCSVSVQQS
jgi:hypothetical protein